MVNPKARRFDGASFALALTIQSLVGSDGRYDRIARLLNNALPLSAQMARKASFSFSPDVDGFVVDQFFKMEACFVHEIALLEGITPGEARLLLRQTPFLFGSAGTGSLTRRRNLHSWFPWLLQDSGPRTGLLPRQRQARIPTYRNC